MDYREAFEQWKTDTFFDEETRAELAALTDEKEIEDRFYRDLEFGTGGLRGIMGAGTNRMNKYTVGKATAGLGNYLLNTYGADACRERGVAIGYDILPTSNVLKYILTDCSWIAVRPSVTEPKIKIYYSIKADSKETAEERLIKMQDTIQTKLGLNIEAL